jgi:outer membrane protein
MKRLVGLAVISFSLVLLFAGLSRAADIKIGYVDFPKIQSESKAGQDAMKSIEKMFKDKQSQLDQRQSELEKMLQELEKQSSILSPDVKKQKEEKLQKEYKELQRFKSDSEEELNKKKSEMAKQMYDEVAAVINKFGKEEGYTLILERSVVLYAPEAVDVTDKVIKMYDETKK